MYAKHYANNYYDLHFDSDQRDSRTGHHHLRNHGNHRQLAGRTDHPCYTLAVLALWIYGSWLGSA